MKPLRIAINAQLLPEKSGGIVSVLVGLVRALGQLDDGPEEFVIVGNRQAPDWLRPFLGSNQRIVTREATSERQVPESRFRRRMRFMLQPGKWFSPPPPSKPKKSWPIVEMSDGFIESLGCNVVHFPYQNFVLCSLPSLYNPHDLQHVHYPQFFAPKELARREVMYTAGCRLSKIVVVGSEWIKQDVVAHFGLPSEKVQVIPWAPPTQAVAAPDEGDIEAVRRKFELDRPFALYPAMTQTHKNHLRLIDALAMLRDREGLRVNLVCTGLQGGNWSNIQDRLKKLGLEDQARFLGMLPREELRAVYRLAQFVVVPTLFEAASGPVFEAWAEGIPVACSTVTSLPQQVGDAALLFDPHSVGSIADAIKQMAVDEEFRTSLVQRGARRLKDFSWNRTARAYRAAYRRAAGWPLDENDIELLSWDWMRDARSTSEANA